MPVMETKHFDLDGLKDKIEDLYMTQKLPLKEVMARLKLEDACYASCNMYIKKIRLWGWEKKNKYQDMVHIQRPIQKNTSFDIRGRKVSGSTIQKYLDRRQARLSAINRANYNSWQRFYCQSPWHVSSVLAPPEELVSYERFFNVTRETQAYILTPIKLSKRIYESGQLELPVSIDLQPVLGRREQLRCTPYNLFYREFILGGMLISTGQIQSAGAAFQLGFSLLRSALQDLGPSFLASTIVLLVVLIGFGASSVAEMVSRNLWNQAFIDLGRDHYLTSWSRFLHRYYNNIEVLIQALMAVCDSSVETLSPNDEWAISNQTAPLFLIGQGISTLSFEGTSQMFSRLIDDYTNSLQTMPRLEVTLRRYYANYLELHGDYEAACTTLEDVPSKLNGEIPNGEDAFVYVIGIVDLSNKLMNLGTENYNRAEALLQRAVVRAKQITGEKSTLSVLTTGYLALFHKEYSATQQFVQEFESISTSLEAFKLHPDGNDSG